MIRGSRCRKERGGSDLQRPDSSRNLSFKSIYRLCVGLSGTPSWGKDSAPGGPSEAGSRRRSDSKQGPRSRDGLMYTLLQAASLYMPTRLQRRKRISYTCRLLSPEVRTCRPQNPRSSAKHCENERLHGATGKQRQKKKPSQKLSGYVRMPNLHYPIPEQLSRAHFTRIVYRQVRPTYADTNKTVRKYIPFQSSSSPASARTVKRTMHVSRIAPSGVIHKSFHVSKSSQKRNDSNSRVPQPVRLVCTCLSLGALAGGITSLSPPPAPAALEGRALHGPNHTLRVYSCPLLQQRTPHGAGGGATEPS